MFAFEVVDEGKGVGYVQFFLEPAASVLGVAATMRSPACLAMAMSESWMSRRLMSVMVASCVCVRYNCKTR